MFCEVPVVFIFFEVQIPDQMWIIKLKTNNLDFSNLFSDKNEKKHVSIVLKAVLFRNCVYDSNLRQTVYINVILSSLCVRTKKGEMPMGLFDVFKGKTPELNPRIALAVGLLFMTSADGAIEQEEFGVLLANLHGDEKLLDNAMAYGKATKFDDYLSASANLLNEPQKICILLNLADALLSDGHAAPQEQALFERFLSGWNITRAAFQPHLDVIIKKNDHSVLS